MPIFGDGADRTRLEGCELEIFKPVRKGATSEQWKEWLRVPLEHAAADGKMDLFTRLMGAGADGSAGWRGCHGRTMLGAAATGKNEEMVLALLRGGAKDDVDVKFGEQQESTLHIAAAHGAEGASRALMFAGADPSLVDWMKRNPLHLAAAAGHDGVVSDLLVKGADPNAKDELQHTPLHLAAEEGHCGVVSDLLVRGADPNAKDSEQNTPFHLAAAKLGGGRVSCVPKLLLGGAEKKSLNGDGQTPLYLAAMGNQLGVVEELLAAKADIDIRNHVGWRPLDIAAHWGNADVVRALLRHGAAGKACDDNGYTALHHAAGIGGAHENGDVIRVLLEAGADIEAKTTNGDGETPLHVAANRRLSSIGKMRALLEGGADVNARDSTENTLLHLGCRCSNVDGVELLLRWGADETLVDQYGDTAATVMAKIWERHGAFNMMSSDYQEGRKADDQRIRHMLAHAPADRSWRRRGWLVLARSRPARIQLANDSSTSSGGSSTKVAKARCDGLGVGEGGDEGLGSLVRTVVGLDAEGVFRLVVGFL